MRASLLNLVVIGALGLTSNSHAAPGFISLPSTGFSSSAYANCYNDGRTASDPKGNFGSYGLWTVPTASINNTCWVNRPAAELVSPISGYSYVGSRTVGIPRSTGDTSGSYIGTLLDYVWRNSTTNMCIIGTRLTMLNTDHESGVAGTQYFQVNDIVRGGFSGLSLKVGYTLFNSTASPVFRVGRTFTSVQHRALRYATAVDKSQNGSNYLDIPTKNGITANISGVDAPIDAVTFASTTLATQDAAVNDNWVDFTVEASYVDSDASAGAVSAFTYIEAPCSENPTIKPGAVRLRQTAQEDSYFKEIIMDGYSIGTP